MCVRPVTLGVMNNQDTKDTRLGPDTPEGRGGVVPEDHWIAVRSHSGSQESARGAMRSWSAPAVHNSTASPGTKRLGKMLDTHLTPLLQAYKKCYEESVTSQTNAIVALINQREKSSQSEATLGIKNEL